MKKIVVTLLFIVLALFNSKPSAKPWVGNVEKFSIDSEVLGESRELLVYLPTDYRDSTQKYPVLYLTDGDVQGLHTAGTVNFFAAYDQAPDMLVVGIITPRDTRTHDLTVTDVSEQALQTPSGADRFLGFVEKEVIPTIKRRYRTLDYQALSGTSHGGQFAINAMLKRPQLFDGVIAISPSLYWKNNQLLTLAEDKLKEKRIKGRVFISIADEPPVMTKPFATLVELSQQYPNDKLHLQSKTFADESHNSTTLLGQYYGLKYLFADWVIPDEPQSLADLQQIYHKRSTTLGAHLQIPEDRANGYGQWLQYLNRKDEALELYLWNRETYPQSISAHQALIKAYLHFNDNSAAKTASELAIKTLDGLNSQQKQKLNELVNQD